jgi:hypothetical protein
MKIQCRRCGSPVEFNDLQMEMLNSPRMSVVTVAHAKPAFCLGCKAPVALLLVNANLHFEAVAAPPAQKPEIIIAPASALRKV